jgi:hypothetical protein
MREHVAQEEEREVQAVANREAREAAQVRRLVNEENIAGLNLLAEMFQHIQDPGNDAEHVSYSLLEEQPAVQAFATSFHEFQSSIQRAFYIFFWCVAFA